jgi:hypothetical protein
LRRHAKALVRKSLGFFQNKKRRHEAVVQAMLFYPNVAHDWGRVAFVKRGTASISRRMAQRLSDAFNFASKRFTGHKGSFWAENEARNADLIAALRAGNLDLITAMANDPGGHYLFWGVDGLTKGFTPSPDTEPIKLASSLALLCDGLLRLAEATGTETVWYPEANLDRSTGFDVDAMLDAIAGQIGEIDFPNPFPDEFGIQTSRGIASYRTFQSIYQAWRLSCLASAIKGQRIIEIGPGIGRTAYYANKFGLKDYTTVDLPLGNIAQACFLSRALGEDAITLPGEPAQQGRVRIETPSWFAATEEKFGIAFNADSMTEMAIDNANAYAEKIIVVARAFVSINHEINAFKIADLPALKGRTDQRFPYWMRKGYVEHHYL